MNVQYQYANIRSVCLKQFFSTARRQTLASDVPKNNPGKVDVVFLRAVQSLNAFIDVKYPRRQISKTLYLRTVYGKQLFSSIFCHYALSTLVVHRFQSPSLFFFFLSLRLIPKKLISSYAGMEECENTNTTTKRKM